MAPRTHAGSRALGKGWTSRLAVAAVVAPVGLTLTATEASPPVPVSWTESLSQSEQRGSPATDDELVTAVKRASVSSPLGRGGLTRGSKLDIPGPALRAYRFAETVMTRADPSCRVDWSLLAAIGDVESDHGRYGGAVVRSDGTSAPRILGPQLDGSAAVAAIRDTDDGALDQDRRWDRAVGPMQFIPSTWSAVGSDADDDGTRDPHDIDDAALSAAVYLCAGDDDLSTTAGQKAAVYRYNHSAEYVDLVLRLAAAYADETLTLSAPQPAVRSARPVEIPSLHRPVQTAAHPSRPLTRAQRSAPDNVVVDEPQSEQPASGQAHAQRSADGEDADGRSATAGRTAPDGDARSRDRTAHEGSAETTRPRRGSSSTESPEGARSRDGSTGDGTGDSGSDAGGSDAGGTTGDGSEESGSDAGGTDAGGSDAGDTTGEGSTNDGTEEDGTAGGTEDDGTEEDGTAGGTEDDGTEEDGTAGGTEDDGTEEDGTAGGTDENGSECAATGFDTSTVCGVLDRSDDGTWLVGSEPVGFGDDAYLAREALHDFDGEHGVETNLDELETLIGQDVSVVLDENDSVQQLNGQTYR